jgi:pyruvate kinase
MEEEIELRDWADDVHRLNELYRSGFLQGRELEDVNQMLVTPAREINEMDTENLNNTILGKNLVGKELESLPHNIWKRIRVLKEDGEIFLGTMEFNPSRINVEVNNGIIVDVISLG